MAEITIAPAYLEHAEPLVAEMRALDRQEAIATAGPDVLKTTQQSIALSYEPCAAHVPDGLLCVFGIAPASLMGDTAAPWALGTDRMTRNAAGVLRIAERYFVWARLRYPVLVNYVDARNTPSIRWLKRVGFTIDPAAPFGVEGLPFHRFHMGLEDV